MMRRRLIRLCLTICVLLSRAGLAQEAKPAVEKKPVKPAAEVQDKLVTTQHTATIQGREIKYTATTGTLVMRDDEGKPKANFFFIAYTKDGVEDLARRPITFAFNGGPGSSSVWLHLGMLGPKRVKVPDDTSVAAPPYDFANNPHSILDLTDLVLIDPVSTGFSRPAEGEEKGQFHGYEEDIASVGQFIHDYVTKYDRWRSPKFIIGESYGGIRSAGLSGYLLERYRMPLAGIVMVSPAINFYTLGFNPGHDLPYVLFMPSYAATAWYHKALPDDLQRLSVEEVYLRAKDFAMNEYTLALMKGHMLSADERSKVAGELSRLTGLSKEFVEDANLRISMQRFGKELLRNRGLTVGRYDARFTGIDADSAGESPEYDPSGSKVFGAFTAAINDYLRNELKFEDPHVYEILGGGVQPWNYGRGNRIVDTSETLRSTMSQNPLMKVFLASGYYDLATPPATATYSLEHMRLPEELQKNITYGFYEAGHMMYIYEPAMERLRKDMEAFYKAALPGATAD
jgi:carboxypeptidase C (cathepsin A)